MREYGCRSGYASVGLRCSAMDWFANNWPVLLITLAIFIIVAGLMRRVAKIAFFGIALGAIALVVWPMVSDSL